MDTLKQKKNCDREALIPTEKINPPAREHEEKVELDESSTVGLSRLSEVQKRKYEKGKVVTLGGMGMIMAAKDCCIRRDVAMKVILPQEAREEVIQRFIQEAQVTGQLEHPNIVPVHELGVDSHGSVFYTMKYVRGKNLETILDELRAGENAAVKEWSLIRLLNVFQRVCEAMAFAHSRGVIHRDLKPANIMVGDFGEVLVVDWGIAKILDSNESEGFTPESDSASDAIPGKMTDGIRKDEGTDSIKTMNGVAMGTPLYMSPEQALGKQNSIDARTDVYALGAILYEILTLRQPVTGDTSVEVLQKVVNGEIVNPLKHVHSLWQIPPALAAVAMVALAREPESRYASVASLLKEITAYLNGFATSAEHAGLFRLIWLAMKRHKAAATVVLTLFLGIVATVCGLLMASRAEVRRSLAEQQRAQAEAQMSQAKLALIEEEKRRQEEWLPVCDFDFNKASLEELTKDFETLWCPNPNIPDRTLVPAPETVRIENGYLLFSGKRSYGRGGLSVLRWRGEPTGSDIQVIVVFSGLQKDQLGLSLAGDSLSGYRVVCSPGDEKVELDTIASIDWQLLQSAHVSSLHDKKDHCMRAEKSGSTIRVFIDDEECIEYYDPLPFNGTTFALSSFYMMPQIHSLKVSRRRPPELVPVLDVAQGLIRAGDMKSSREYLHQQSALWPNNAIGVEAELLLGVTLQREGKQNEAVQAFKTAGEKALKLADEPEKPGKSDSKTYQKMASSAFDLASRLLAKNDDFIGAASMARQIPSDFMKTTATDRLAGILQLKMGQQEGKKPLSPDEELTFIKTVSSLPVKNWTLNGPRSLAGLEKASKLEQLMVLPRIRRPDEDEVSEISDLSPLRGLPIRQLKMFQQGVKDLSPLQGMKFKYLFLDHNNISDISPLAGMPLEGLSLTYNPVTSIQSLKGMNLRNLAFSSAQVSDLSPLAGMPLISLNIRGGNQISSLSPLAGAPLTSLLVEESCVSDLSPLRSCPIEDLKIDSSDLADLSAIKGMPLKSLSFSINRVSSLEPLKGMNLQLLYCSINQISSLEPLRGMKLQTLFCSSNQISDLSPLHDLPLRSLACGGNPLSDLSPLSGLPLTNLYVAGSKLTDISPLRGCRLEELGIDFNNIADITPLAGMPLMKMFCVGNRISSLAPLQGMKLKRLYCNNNQISDLGPLTGMPLQTLSCGGNPLNDLSPLRGMPLEEFFINGLPAVPLNRKNIEVIRELPVRNLYVELGDPAVWELLDSMPKLQMVNGMPVKQLVKMRHELEKSLRGEKADLRQFAMRTETGEYLYVPIQSSWQEASAFAEKQGARLACLPDTMKKKALADCFRRSNINQYGNYTSPTMVGWHARIEDSDCGSWVDGTPLAAPEEKYIRKVLPSIREWGKWYGAKHGGDEAERKISAWFIGDFLIEPCAFIRGSFIIEWTDGKK